MAFGRAILHFSPLEPDTVDTVPDQWENHRALGVTAREMEAACLGQVMGIAPGTWRRAAFAIFAAVLIALQLGGLVAGRPTGPGSMPVGVPVRIQLNGLSIGATGALIGDWTFVNIDRLIPVLGGRVEQQPSSKSATIELGGRILSVVAGRDEVSLGGEQVALPAAPRWIAHALYVPIRGLITPLGMFALDWSQATRTLNLVSVSSAPAPSPPPDVPPVTQPPVAAPPAAATAPPPEATSVSTSTPAPATVSSTTSTSTAAATTSSDAIPVPFTEADRVLMARVIDSELPDGPFEAQVGVGAVIVNRVHSPGFADTVSAVVDDPGQFQGVGDVLFNRPPTKNALAAALDALEGQDPTGGALYFFNPSKTTNQWALSLPVTVTIGPMRFAR